MLLQAHTGCGRLCKLNCKTAQNFYTQKRQIGLLCACLSLYTEACFRCMKNQIESIFYN